MDEIYPDLVVEVCRRLSDTNLKWYLIGSTGLALRGVDIGRNPKDIDILIHLSDLSDAKELFADYRPFCEERKLGEGHGEQFRLRIYMDFSPCFSNSCLINTIVFLSLPHNGMRNVTNSLVFCLGEGKGEHKNCYNLMLNNACYERTSFGGRGENGKTME